MSLFSAEFLVLFLLFLSLYWVVLDSFKKPLLLVFSYTMLYLIKPEFLLINFVFGLVVYIFGRLLLLFNSKILLFLSIAFVILTLSFFKYNEFFMLNFALCEIIMPLGISFYSFCSITLLVLCYKNEIKELKLTSTLLYLSFFITITSGPIFRYDEFEKEISKSPKFGDLNLILALIVLACFKKLLVANHLFSILNPTLISPANSDFLTLINTLFGYSFLLYCDFSGYVDLVTALALMLGITLPKNFNKPFVSLNVKEFWNRWHITLGRFFKDFLYIPLGGNRRGAFRTNLNVLLVFLVSGFWHGNTFSFIIWGLCHGLFVVFNNITKNYNIPKFDYLKMLTTFIFVSLAWVFFATENSFLYIESLINSEILYTPVNIGIMAFMAIFIYIYPKFNTLNLLKSIFDKIPSYLLPFIFAIIFSILYKFMPSGMPNFIYQGF
ncbi:MBOAT family O-acyltransferase [Campylobacter corcagiensis]|uniref:MBOAT family protein n=1 Tax=Campylobacter corcagiensis TaxID=1448857 RepID=A0A7M1LHL9_9BACT|nr:MBOAT family O-acyltransferase [Campylobacter corcagiensis]QKF63954.1 membrane-bound O-acyl transferase, MBOAT family [Campylobacter corcagiensis]QOQ87843.1 MBOAT family protein [Campylobacter corcagiensis]